MQHAALGLAIDAKLDEYSACERPHEVQRLAQALLAFADHPSRHAPDHRRTFTSAFGEILPPDLEGVDERFERCRNALVARFSKEPANGQRKLFEHALGGVAYGVQKPARPLLMKLLEISKAQVAEPSRRTGPPTTVTVRFPVEVSESGHVLERATLAAFDGIEPDGDTFVDEAPALNDVPGRRTTKLRLGYDAKSGQLSCLLIMELNRPLDDDELERLRAEWLVELGEGFDSPERWHVPGDYNIVVNFGAVMAIDQVAAKKPSAKKPSAKKPSAKKPSAKIGSAKKASKMLR